jgi:hypothetical protein
MLPCLVLLPCKVKVWVLYIFVRNRSLDEQCSVHQFISHNSYSKPNPKAIPYVAVCIGCLFILRGLGLEILYSVEYEFVYSRKSKLSLTLDLIGYEKARHSRAFLYIIKH